MRSAKWNRFFTPPIRAGKSKSGAISPGCNTDTSLLILGPLRETDDCTP